MMGLFNQASTSINKAFSSPTQNSGTGSTGTTSAPTSPRRRNSEGAALKSASPERDEDDEEDTELLDENEGSILTSMISQLRVGMDLSRVTFPTFVLEPRSMLERITDFMSHPDLVFGAENDNNPEERFMMVLQYYLGGWHIKPRGVKKPYNPVLGEFFRSRYSYSNGTHGFYISEQVSHHPPISAFYYISPANKLAILGELRPKSKFLGNSVSTNMEGENRVTLLGRKEDGEYVITMPNMYARGILFGRMVLELGDTCVARNEKTGMVCDLEFKTKGFFSGTYNALAGRVRQKERDVGEVTGKWTGKMFFKSAKTGERRTIFDAKTDGTKIAPMWVPSLDQQQPNESRRLWKELTQAIGDKNMDAATTAKTKVEDAQREERRLAEERKTPFVPKFFKWQPEKDGVPGRWIPKIVVPDDPVEAEKVVADWIFPGIKLQEAV